MTDRLASANRPPRPACTTLQALSAAATMAELGADAQVRFAVHAAALTAITRRDNRGRVAAATPPVVGFRSGNAECDDPGLAIGIDFNHARVSIMEGILDRWDAGCPTGRVQWRREGCRDSSTTRLRPMPLLR